MTIHTVTYLPRGERSVTKRLVDAALDAIGDRATVDRLELATAVPDLFTPARLWDYIRRNYLGEALGPESQMGGMDALTDRLVAADAVILATPMHNFSLPAVVKAWFDAVMLKGRTWDLGETGFVPLLPGRRALVLASAGGIYTDPAYAPYEHLVSLAKVEFGFMGYDPVEAVFAQGMNVLDETGRETALVAAEERARAAAARLIA